MEPKDLVFLIQDDIDRHGEECGCGLCNAVGKSYGVAVKTVIGLDNDDLLIRIYAASADSAYHNARMYCSKEGLHVVEIISEDYVAGEALIDLDNVIGCSLEDFLDLISSEVTGTDLLQDISYEVVGVQDGLLKIRVTGSVVGIRDCLGSQKAGE